VLLSSDSSICFIFAPFIIVNQRVLMAQPSLIPAILQMKCPKCRKGQVFANKHILPLNKCLKINDHCPVCEMKLISEANNGPGINYALTVLIFFLNILWYYPIFGLSYKDYSFYYFLATTTAVVIVLQPWLMRLSRIIYLYIYVKMYELS